MWCRVFLLLAVAVLSSCRQEDVAVELESKKQHLAKLASYSPRGEVGAIGYRSKTHRSDQVEEWVQVEFETPAWIDEVVLVPSMRRDSKEGLQAAGFPEKFELLVTSADGSVERITMDDKVDSFLPRIAPLVVPLDQPLQAKSVKLRALRLGNIGWNDTFAFALAEMMVFSEGLNVALHQEVSARTNGRSYAIARSRDLRYLVDGHLPYGMDAALGARSTSYLASQPVGGVFIWEIDLDSAQELERFRYHRIELDDTVPKSESGDYGVASSVKVLGSLTPDFAVEQELLGKLELKSIYEKGPILHFALKSTPVRYVRFVFETDTIERDFNVDIQMIGCAEIELIKEGQNVALGKELRELNLYQNCPMLGKRSKAAVTDGRNFYGEILPLRRWLEELATRHRLELEIPVLESEMVAVYGRQKRIVAFGVGVVALCFILSFYFSWWRPRLERRKFKERFAADIHDELGANLHTISFISDQLEDEEIGYEGVLKVKRKIRHVAERAGRVVYHMSGVLEGSDLYRGLLDDIKRASERVLGTYDHSMKVQGEELLEKVPKKLQVDILLFYQECLVNIGRHSDAEKFVTELVVEPKLICLRVRDFGGELEDHAEDVMSESLLRRAKLLRGKVSVTQPAGGGTMVTLKKKW